MKLLLFSPYFYPYLSGLTAVPYRLFSRLDHEVTVLTFPHQAALPPVSRLPHLTIVRMPYLFRLSKGFISPASIIYFYRYLKAADLVVLNLPSAEGLPLALLARLLGTPVIGLYYCRVHLGAGVGNRVINGLLNLAVKLQLALSRQIITLTADYRDHDAFLTPYQAKTSVIPPPVPLLPVDQAFLKDLKRQKQAAVWIGFVGRIAREKGLEYLIDAVSRLGHQKSYVLVMAGPAGSEVAGEQAYYRSLMEMAAQKQIRFHHFGVLSPGRLGALYQAMDVLVLPSVNPTEAFGMVQVEAMMQGTPVIASDLPGVRVPVRTTGMGQIVSPADSRAIAQALLSVIGRPGRFTTPARVKAAGQAYNVDRILHQFEALFAAYARH